MASNITKLIVLITLLSSTESNQTNETKPKIQPNKRTRLKFKNNNHTYAAVGISSQGW
jgi:hypothetical protein